MNGRPNARVQKCHFSRIEKIAKMALLNPCMKFKKIKKDSQDFKNSFQFGFL